jgi:uncharacterized damage-inducible protein DinB
MEVKDLVCYNHYVRGLYFDSMAKLPWDDVIKPLGLSFDSMRNVFLHLTVVEDRWISYIIPGRFNEWVDQNFDVYANIDSLKNYMLQTKNNTLAYLANASSRELNKQIVIPWGKTADTEISIQTALTHMVMEDMIHYGELSAALWQMGLEAPYMGFWRFKYENL